MSLLGKRVAYSGGGYFRLFPLPLIQKQITNSSYAMTYFHIGDLMKEPKQMMSKEAYESYFKESGTITNRLKRYIKSNIGIGDTQQKLSYLIRQNTFVNIKQANEKISWSQIPSIQL